MTETLPWQRSGVVLGEVCTPRNMSIDAGAGSIHDDSTAQTLGFAAGTVAADVHVDQFPPVLVDLFGPTWFETGTLSLYFRTPTAHLEPVVVAARPIDDRVADVWLLRAGANAADAAVAEASAADLVAEGSAAVGVDQPISALRARDLRPVDPATLTQLRELAPGTDLGTQLIEPDADRQRRRLEADEMTAPLPWYDESSPWGGAVASPQTLVALMARRAGKEMEARVRGDFVGMWGACEIRHYQPVSIDGSYSVSSRVVAVSASPRSEIVWFESEATDADGKLAASLFMMSRVLPGANPEG